MLTDHSGKDCSVTEAQLSSWMDLLPYSILLDPMLSQVLKQSLFLLTALLRIFKSLSIGENFWGQKVIKTIYLSWRIE